MSVTFGPCGRAPPALRPLFLAAPGVANAQSAYFSFSQFLQWSDQPIYVLDKVSRASSRRAEESQSDRAGPCQLEWLHHHTMHPIRCKKFVPLEPSWLKLLARIVSRPLPACLDWRSRFLGLW